MKTDLPKHYIDTNVINGYLNQREEKSSECASLIQAAERGEITLYTSAFSLAEVVYTKSTPVVEEQESLIETFFLSSWLNIVGFDFEMASIHRHLMRQYSQHLGQPKLKLIDAAHLATAIHMKVDYFNTLDVPLRKAVPQKINYPPHYPKLITLQEPFIPGFQKGLF